MSMLLEALKKSEEQRRLGATPTLQTPVDEAAAEDDSLQHWLPLVLMAVSVITITWFGWQQYRPPEPAVAGSLPERPPAQVQATRAEPASGPSSVAPRGAEESGSPPEPADSAQGRTPVESFQAAENVADTQPQASAQAVSIPEPASQGGLDDLRKAPQAEAETADREAQENDVTETESPALAESPAASARKPATPHESAPISYWELPQTVRDSLPEFRINVLVYADQPEDRFLLMGGQRLVENETVDGGLVLEEIRREGAVFRYRKYRFLVKR